jgi:hypothetical protein
MSLMFVIFTVTIKGYRKCSPIRKTITINLDVF